MNTLDIITPLDMGILTAPERVLSELGYDISNASNDHSSTLNLDEQELGSVPVSVNLVPTFELVGYLANPSKGLKLQDKVARYQGRYLANLLITGEIDCDYITDKSTASPTESELFIQGEPGRRLLEFYNNKYISSDMFKSETITYMLHDLMSEIYDDMTESISLRIERIALYTIFDLLTYYSKGDVIIAGVTSVSKNRKQWFDNIYLNVNRSIAIINDMLEDELLSTVTENKSGLVDYLSKYIEVWNGNLLRGTDILDALGDNAPKIEEEGLLAIEENNVINGESQSYRHQKERLIETLPDSDTFLITKGEVTKHQRVSSIEGVLEGKYGTPATEEAKAFIEKEATIIREKDNTVQTEETTEETTVDTSVDTSDSGNKDEVATNEEVKHVTFEEMLSISIKGMIAENTADTEKRLKNTLVKLVYEEMESESKEVTLLLEKQALYIKSLENKITAIHKKGNSGINKILKKMDEKICELEKQLSVNSRPVDTLDTNSITEMESVEIDKPIEVEINTTDIRESVNDSAFTYYEKMIQRKTNK